MRPIRWRVSTAAVLLFALFYFFDSEGMAAALFPAVLVHELGHIAVLLLFHAPPRRIQIGVFGVEISYGGILAPARLLLSLFAGPLAGLVYGFVACRFGGSYLRLSGAVSLSLSALNLLPVLPLDGGRILGVLTGERAAKIVSSLLSLLITGFGLWRLLCFRDPAPLGLGLWLFLCHLRYPA